jgi:hypothetical protein
LQKEILMIHPHYIQAALRYADEAEEVNDYPLLRWYAKEVGAPRTRKDGAIQILAAAYRELLAENERLQKVGSDQEVPTIS